MLSRLPDAVPLAAHNDELTLAGALWLPTEPPSALLLMHPGSGPADRDNDTFFPPIRAALLDSGVAVASFDKRGIGDSGGSWLDAGIEQQAADLLAGLATAAEFVPDVAQGVFGHSEGGWVAFEAARIAARGEIDFVITSAGPAVGAAAAERYASRRALARSGLGEPERSRAADAAGAFFALAESGAHYAEMLALTTAHASDLAHLLGDGAPDEGLWEHFVRLSAFDPLPRLRGLRVPLLAVFGADDELTPTAASVQALREAVDPALLHVAVLPDAGHRMSPPDRGDFVAGYPDILVEFVLDQRR